MRSGIGDTLRLARRARGLSLKDAADATRVRETYLAALEEEDFDALGGDVYARGFLRSYARFLDLDPLPLIAAYTEGLLEDERRTRGRPSRRAGSAPDAPGARPGPSRERPPGTAVLLALVVVVLLVVAAVGLFGGDAGASSQSRGAATEGSPA